MGQTLKEKADSLGISYRTAKRWRANGANLDDPSSVALYKANRKSAGPGRTETEPEQAFVQSAGRKQFDVRTTEQLIEVLNSFAAEAASDLDDARKSGAPQKIVAQAHKTFNDAVSRLSQVLLRRDELSQGREDQYSVEEILTVFNDWGWLIQRVLHELPKQVAYRALDESVVSSSQTAGLVDVVDHLIKANVHRTIGDIATTIVTRLSETKRRLSLEEREHLYHHVLNLVRGAS